MEQLWVRAGCGGTLLSPDTLLFLHKLSLPEETAVTLIPGREVLRPQLRQLLSAQHCWPGFSHAREQERRIQDLQPDVPSATPELLTTRGKQATASLCDKLLSFGFGISR